MPSSKPSPSKKPATAKKAAAPRPAKAAPAKAPAPKPAAKKNTDAKPAPKAKPAAPAKAPPPAAAKPAEAPAKKTARPVAAQGFTIVPFSRSGEGKKTSDAAPAAKAQKLTMAELRKLREELVAMRNRLTAKTTVMKQVALERNEEITTEEDGIDQFERLFEIEKIASVQEFVYLIDEALLAFDNGVYGVCQKCACHIEKARIQALPFAKTCIRCQNETERLAHR